MRLKSFFVLAAVVSSGCSGPTVRERPWSVSLAGAVNVQAATCATISYSVSGLEIDAKMECGEAESLRDIEAWFSRPVSWHATSEPVKFDIEIYDESDDIIACGSHPDVTECAEVCVVELEEDC